MRKMILVGLAGAVAGAVLALVVGWLIMLQWPGIDWPAFFKDYQTLIASVVALLAAATAFASTQMAASKQIKTALAVKKQEIDHNNEKIATEITRRRHSLSLMLLLKLIETRSIALFSKKFIEDRCVPDQTSYVEFRKILSRFAGRPKLEIDWENIAILSDKIQGFYYKTLDGLEEIDRLYAIIEERPIVNTKIDTTFLELMSNHLGELIANSSLTIEALEMETNFYPSRAVNDMI